MIGWYSPSRHLKLNVLKYCENNGTSGGYLGDNYWNKGKTQEIKSRVMHI